MKKYVPLFEEYFQDEENNGVRTYIDFDKQNERRYLERRRGGHEEREKNKLHPKDKNELQDMIVKAIAKNGPEADLNHIDTSEIEDMSDLFGSYYRYDDDKTKILRSFNGDISDWDVSNVKNMSYMFCSAESFNGDISDWDVSNVTKMSCMFYGAASFNQDISRWDVSNVKDMFGMFYNAESFNSDISKWDVSNVENMRWMFYNCPIREDFKPKG